MDKNEIFDKIKTILLQFEDHLIVVHDETDNYYLNTPITETNKKVEFFGAVQIKKSYVVFHLMPIYYYPELLDSISQELKTRLHGKSCFNFKNIDNNLLEELNTLTKNAFGKYTTLNKV